jgi:hypothetical protein
MPLQSRSQRALLPAENVVHGIWHQTLRRTGPWGGFLFNFFLMSPLKHQFGHSLTDFVISLFVPGVVQCRRFPGQESWHVETRCGRFAHQQSNPGDDDKFLILNKTLEPLLIVVQIVRCYRECSRIWRKLTNRARCSIVATADLSPWNPGRQQWLPDSTTRSRLCSSPCPSKSHKSFDGCQPNVSSWFLIYTTFSLF